MPGAVDGDEPASAWLRAIGERIQRHRTSRGLSRESLAHLIGRSERWLVKVEQAETEPRLSDLARMAEVLKVDLHIELLQGGSEQPAAQPSATAASASAQPRVSSASDPGMMDRDPWPAGISPGEWLEEMRRRAFLRAMATVTGATAIGWWPSPTPVGDKSSSVATLREVLLDHDVSTGLDGAPNLAVLRRSVHDLWAAFQGARYAAALDAMPEVLREGQLAVRTLDGNDRLTAAVLLSQTYQATSTFMRKVGDANLATLAADRAMAAASLYGSPVTIAESARFMCLILSDTGQSVQALRVCSTAASRFESEVQRPDPAALSIYGQLILAGAEAAAHASDATLCRELFHQASSIGRRIGRDANHSFTAFGPTNIAVHQVHAAVVLGDGDAAVRQAKNIDLARLPVLERRSHHLLDVGLGYNLIGKSDDAAVSLLTAEQHAPEEIRYDPLARLLAEQLRQRSRSLAGHLDALVGRMSPQLS